MIRAHCACSITPSRDWTGQRVLQIKFAWLALPTRLARTSLSSPRAGVLRLSHTAKGHLNVEYRDENVRGFPSLAITEQGLQPPSRSGYYPCEDAHLTASIPDYSVDQWSLVGLSIPQFTHWRACTLYVCIGGCSTHLELMSL